MLFLAPMAHSPKRFLLYDCYDNSRSNEVSIHKIIKKNFGMYEQTPAGRKEVTAAGLKKMGPLNTCDPNL